MSDDRRVTPGNLAAVALADVDDNDSLIYWDASEPVATARTKRITVGDLRAFILASPVVVGDDPDSGSDAVFRVGGDTLIGGSAVIDDDADVVGDFTVGGTANIVGALTAGSTTTFHGIVYTWPAAQTANYFLKTDGAGALSWASPIGAIGIDDLNDVTITAASAGQVLRWSGTQWVNSTDGSALTALVASNLASGTVPNGRLTGAYTAVTGLGIQTQGLQFDDAAYDIGSGGKRPRDFTLSRNAVIGGTLGVTGAATAASFAGDGSLLTALNGTQVTSGSVPAARLAAHDLVTAHSGSGLTAGQVVRATGATTFAWAALQFADLGGVPTTLAGHGITNAYTKGDVDTTFGLYYTKTESDALYAAASGADTFGQVTISKALGNARILRYATAGVTRWDIAADSASETGSNAGSSLLVTAYDDDGDEIDIPFKIRRAADGKITLARHVAAGTDATFDLGSGNRFRDLILSRNAVIGGDATVSGTLTVATITSTTITATTFTAGSFVTGAFTSSAATVTTLHATAAVTLDTTLGVAGATTLAAVHATGAATLDSTLDVAGNFAIATNKFTVAAASGNTVVTGTLSAAGTTVSTLHATGAVTFDTTLTTANGGTGVASYTAGDLSYFAAGTAFTKLAIGTASQMLRSTGTAPAWSTATFPNTATAGDLMVATGANAWGSLAIGANLRVLQSNGSAAAWVANLDIGTGTLNTGAATHTTVHATGAVTMDSTATVAGITSSANVTANGAAATARGMRVTTAGSLRWFANGDAAAESGANAGTAWRLSAYDDSGVAIDDVIVATRAASGVLFFQRPTNLTTTVTIGGTLAVTGVATLTAQPILSSLTASRAVFSDASKGLVSNAITGTGNVVMSASPTITGTLTAAAANFSAGITATTGRYNSTLSMWSQAAIEWFSDGGVTGIWYAGPGVSDGSTDFQLYSIPTSGVRLRITTSGDGTFNGTWTSRDLLAITDATYDMGASAASRFRDFFLSRNAVIGGTLTIGGAFTGATTGAFSGLLTTALIAATSIATTGTQSAHAASKVALEFTSGFGQLRSWGADNSTRGGLQFVLLAADGTSSTTALSLANTTATLNGHFVAFTDATYDIGASGATRFRDLFLSRNATIGGTLGIGGAFSGATTGAFSGLLTTAAITASGLVSIGAGGMRFTANVASDAAGGVTYNSTDGLRMWGKAGSSYDWSILNNAGSYVIRVPTATQNVQMLGALAITGALTGATTGSFTGQLNVLNIVASDDIAGAGIISTSRTTDTFRAFGATTTTRYLSQENTGGGFYAGIESSAGGAILPGSTAYAGAIAAASTVLQLGGNNTLGLTLSSSSVKSSLNLLATTDATVDVGASGANRFRDFFLSRNATIGGALDVTGNVTTALDFALSTDRGIINSASQRIFTANGTAQTVTITNGAAANTLVVGASSTVFSGVVTLTSAGAISGFTTFTATNLATWTMDASSTASILDLKDTDSGVGTDTMVRFYRNGSVSGSITTTLALVTAYNTTSDRRLKIDRGVAVSVDVLRALVVHDFDWVIGGERSRGVFAQDAYEHAPYMIHVGGDELDTMGRPVDPWGADYSKLVPDLLVGWQDHDRRLEDFAADFAAVDEHMSEHELRILALESEVDHLTGELAALQAR